VSTRFRLATLLASAGSRWNLVTAGRRADVMEEITEEALSGKKVLLQEAAA
jgi:hypothetical protein